ncbi:RagB/SusD family nutrient uptake outer membrane protein [Parabacteroides pacaensis]|uniref:RagB/SusD family nutrient uptake outer membrane protein n=1 Tax=Parabacteroides pacaensis TaxID=2086575 RepID=UPI000D0EC349|nr:RagB/SusD family nutrient uptake outer membrane protein [Parabacteroides pacaensis]
MKKYNLFIVLISLLTISCEDFLDRDPLDKITDVQMSFTAKEMELYANKYYGNFPTLSGFDYGPYERDNASDNLVSGAYNYDAQISGTITVPSSGGGWNWEMLRGLNFFIENYHKSPDPITQTAPYIGEIYFWRAWFYYDKLKQFGDLPWINKALDANSEALYDGRISRSIITDSILADLDKATLLLPEKESAIAGRLHKDAALLFQSRVALYEGCWEKYHDGTPFGVQNAKPDKYFRIATEAAKTIIDKEIYKIEPVDGDKEKGYWKLFNQTDLSANKEVLLWKKYDMSLGVYNNSQNIWGVSDNNTGVSKYMVNSYLCTDGKPISISPLYQGDDLIENEVKDRDPRLAQTIFLKGEPRVIINGQVSGYFTLPDMTYDSRLRNTTGYQLAKGCDPSAVHEGGYITASIIFRYAEVLCNYAEAKAELEECTQSDLDLSVNQLRERVGMPYMTVNVGFNDPDWDFPELSPLLNEIRRERRIEFACEGYRFDDLMRWAAVRLIKRPMIGAKMKQFADVKDEFKPVLDPEAIPVNEKGYIAPHWNSPAKNGWKFDENKNWLKPLPSNELVLNSNLKQNPGY